MKRFRNAHRIGLLAIFFPAWILACTDSVDSGAPADAAVQEAAPYGDSDGEVEAQANDAGPDADAAKDLVPCSADGFCLTALPASPLSGVREFFDVWSGADGTWAVAQGDTAEVLRYDGQRWKLAYTPLPGEPVSFTALTGDGRGHIIAVGLRQSDPWRVVLTLKGDGTVTADASGDFGTDYVGEPLAIATAADHSVWVASNRKITRWDGSAWQVDASGDPLPSDGFGPFSSLWTADNSVFVGGNGASDGGGSFTVFINERPISADAGWVSSSHPYDPAGFINLRKGWANAFTDQWVVSDSFVDHVTVDASAQWSTLVVPKLCGACGFATTTDLWGTSASNMWFVGDLGAVSHYDGTAFKHVTLVINGAPISKNLRAIFGISANDFWIVGTGVAIHRVTP